MGSFWKEYVPSIDWEAVSKTNCNRVHNGRAR